MRVKDDSKKRPFFTYRKKLEPEPEDVCKEIIEDLLCSMFPREEASQQGVWLAEPSLGPGWKSCLITPARGQCQGGDFFYNLKMLVRFLCREENVLLSLR